MKVSKVLRSIKTQPQVWTLGMDNDICMSFKYGDYRFVKFNKDCSNGSIKLYNKKLNVEMDWEANDAVASQLWSSVIMCYLTNHIVNK